MTLARKNWNSTAGGAQATAFNPLSVTGQEYYSGADVRVFFDDIEIEEADAIGFQMSQNVRPVYSYHSHVFSAIQYGTKLVQGYFQIHISQSGYLNSILAAIEYKRRKLVLKDTTAGPPSPFSISTLTTSALPASMTQALNQLTNQQDPDAWRSYVARLEQSWLPTPGTTNETMVQTQNNQSIHIPGLFPPEPCGNYFTFNPAGTTLASQGFPITIIYGNTAFTGSTPVFNNGVLQTTQGTVRRLYEAHVIAGPNSQITADEGKPIAELFTFIAKDIT